MENYNDLVNEDIRQAMLAIEKKHETVIKDTSRPGYHFASPAKMLIDVWGGIFHKGYYHLFYDINYRVDEERQGGSFGHVRSRDLVEWENLPLALLPDCTRGEDKLNDGTVVIAPSGRPLMYYTRCFEDETRNREHVPVRGSDNLIVWNRFEDDNLTITMENHGGPKFHMSWSDPIIFTECGRTFMIISKCTVPDKGGMIPIYEAVDDEWLKWEYRGIFADHTGEVVNFIKLKDKWVLIYSPYSNPKYFVGTFDLRTYQFICEKEGVLSYGYIKQGYINDISRGFYATSSFYGEEKKPYILGWISGFMNPEGWDGCVSLARTLDIDEEGNLLMQPAPQLEKLREKIIRLDPYNKAKCGCSFEIDAEFELKNDSTVEIAMSDSFKLEISDNKIKFNEIECDYNVDSSIKMRMYIDVTVAEIFFDDGKISISRCFKEIDDNAELKVKCTDKINKFDIYKLRNIYRK